jgi:hypothetical protein
MNCSSDAEMPLVEGEHMQHPDEGTVHAWLDGALPAAESERLERHVAECAACAAMVAEARGLIAGAAGIVSSLDVVRGGVMPQQPVVTARSGSLWRTLRVTPVRAALAASLLIAAGAMLSIRHDTDDKIVPRVPSASTVSSTPVNAPAPVAPPISTAAPTAAALKEIPPRRSVGEAAMPAAIRASVPASAAPAAAPAAVTAALATVDSVGPAREKIAESPVDSAKTPQVMTERRSFARTMQQQEASGLAASTRSFVGCYRLPSDTVSWLRSIPERFALQQNGGATGPTNVVRAVAADGRLDSVVAGSTWLQLAPQLARVNFFFADRREAVTLQLAASGVVTARPSVGGMRAVNVVQTECRR